MGDCIVIHHYFPSIHIPTCTPINSEVLIQRFENPILVHKKFPQIEIEGANTSLAKKKAKEHQLALRILGYVSQFGATNCRWLP